jgi:hypothetical protein
MNKLELDEKMYNLSCLKGVLDNTQYKRAAATIITKYYLEMIKEKEVEISRLYLSDRVNLMMKRYGVEKIGYKFFRKYTMK